MTHLRLAMVGLAFAQGLVFGGCNHNAPRTSGDRVPAADLALVGCDETTGWDDKLGLQPAAPGADELLFIDFRSPVAPKIHARLPLRNSVYGPPTNLVVSRSGGRALVASSIRMTQATGTWTNSPDSEVHVIDLPATAHTRSRPLQSASNLQALTFRQTRRWRLWQTARVGRCPSSTCAATRCL